MLKLNYFLRNEIRLFIVLVFREEEEGAVRTCSFGLYCICLYSVDEAFVIHLFSCSIRESRVRNINL